MITISVIIPAFNAKKWIPDAVQSVLDQGMDSFEIIIVDDGSTDGTEAMVQERFPFVNFIRTKNLGPSSARNIGTKVSKGQYIQYLDADDMLAPEKVKIQLAALQESNSDIAYGNWQKIVADSTGQYVKGELVVRYLPDPEVDLFTDKWSPISSYLFRRRVIEGVGEFDEELPVVEDAQFLIHCALRQFRFTRCEGVMAYYRVSDNSLSRQDPMRFIRCCLKNAFEVERWWDENGGIDDKRLETLITVYGYIARASFEKDKPTFNIAYKTLGRLEESYIPRAPLFLKWVSYIAGYRMAEVVAVHYRRIKKKLKWL